RGMSPAPVGDRREMFPAPTHPYKWRGAAALPAVNQQPGSCEEASGRRRCALRDLFRDYPRFTGHLEAICIEWLRKQRSVPKVSQISEAADAPGWRHIHRIRSRLQNEFAVRALGGVRPAGID